MSVEKKKAVIEALLFAWGEEISVKEISKATGYSYHEVRLLLTQMEEDYKFYHRGIILLRMGDYYQLSTNPAYSQYIEKLISPQKCKSISQAVLETLAIIAYKQPITRSLVDSIRGVKSDHAIRTLLDKDLIEIKGRLDKIGKPILYGTTHTFLKSFGLTTLDELPNIEVFTPSENDDHLDI
ncbi:segregation and condensation protein B [Tindallia magadiensis]|uniref:Segregation and condensation protein B n=1 Tax=Tindallia magadiensis TaxID=69895 RepID=A0A1I3AFH3_9FIRM|nr:SMC-Scp complex subunit ScpB [Tindallia magadiensis]SFH48710.1 segregation and condensation protein B [Tindallia magadiensis]